MVPPHEVFARLEAARFVGVLRSADPEAALAHARAALETGLAALELTCTIPDVTGVTATLALEFPAALLGVGTVLSLGQARAAQAAGAAFLVSPHLDAALLAGARAAGLAYVPGAFTPSEFARAQALGASLVKLFPVARAGGPAYVRDLMGPFPDARLLVTGGVGLEAAADYLAAGAAVVGLGSVFGQTPEETAARVAALLR